MTSNLSSPLPVGPAADGTTRPTPTGRPPAGSRSIQDALRTVRAGFPGPAVTGVTMILAPLLAVAGTALGMGIYHATGADFVRSMVAQPVTFNLAIQLALSAIVLLLIATVGLATMVCATAPRWGRWAGVVAIIGLAGPISFESIYWAASQITDTAAHRATAGQLIDNAQIIPRLVLNVSGPAIVVGFILLAIATVTSGLLDRPRAVALGLTALIPFGFISGYLVISLVGFAGTAVALVPLGIRVLRNRADAV